MGAILKEIEEQALRLPPKERSELAHRLLVSLDVEPEDSPEAIAKAWDEEIARRVADYRRGTHKMDSCRCSYGQAPRKNSRRQS